MQVEAIVERGREIPWLIKSERRTGGIVDLHRAQVASNIRAVGFIAKPEVANELARCLEGPLVTLLREMPGFQGAVILHSHKEWRNVTVLTLWKTENQAMQTCWEDLTKVCDLVYPLVDVCTRVQTFQGTFAQACGADCEDAEVLMNSF
jgi:hypothetical protein